MTEANTRPRYRVDLLSLALLVVSLVSIVLVLIGIHRHGSSPIWLWFPVALALWNVATLRRRV